LQSLGCSRAILTHVLTPGRFSEPQGETGVEAESYLKVQARQLQAQGLEVALETPTGPPGQSLNRVAQKHDASLMILGSHGKSLWREGILGSFSSAVLHQARYPVLLLPVRFSPQRQINYSLWQCTDLLRHVLFPTDFSEIAAEALVVLELLAPKGVGLVTLLHALKVSLGHLFTSPRQVDQVPEYKSLEILRHRLEAAGVPEVRAQLTPGHPFSVILEAARTLDISLILMGTQGRGFIEELFLGSVAHNISRVADCPVLLIPWINR
jgi:nucleotide-binding universal stress UspA family protein